MNKFGGAEHPQAHPHCAYGVLVSFTLSIAGMTIK